MKQPSMLDVNPTARRDQDFYATPAWMTRALLHRTAWCPDWTVFEPCVGDGAIIRALPPGTLARTNDVVCRGDVLPDFLLDARLARSWTAFRGPGDIDVTLSNLPFNIAIDIVPHAVMWSRIAVVALLRLTFSEPTLDRCCWLAKHPPTHQIVLPRHDFRGNGRTDSVPPAWFIWEKTPGFCRFRSFAIVTPDERDAYLRDGSR